MHTLEKRMRITQSKDTHNNDAKEDAQEVIYYNLSLIL